MLSTLRIAAVVGVIYYLSPVRHEDAKAGVEHVVAWGKEFVLSSRETIKETSSAERLEGLWKALPEDTKQAVIERVLSEAGKPLPQEPASAHKPLEAKKPKP